PDTTLVMQEMPEPRATHVFKRGDFLSPGEKVEPGVPAALHPFPEGAPRNRLGLARWLTDRRNPLTARVTVNRWWAEFFGRGLVETPEDFGTQGAPPTHPGLLDWLAVEFMDCGWSRKHVHRLIVTSATYRQSSRASPELWKRDPANALLARGPRFRLPAEAVRDNALAVAGLLSRKMGGPPVKPPQPPGVWNVTGMVDNTYRVSAGEDRYRRGLYTIWRRSAPYPSFVAFDAPDRSSCVVQRPRTNTPLQALALMNGEVYVEAARAFARRVLAECGGGEREQVAWAFRACLARPPTSEEVHILAEVYGRELARFRTDPGAARALIGPGECPDGVEAARLAALFHVTTILLNLDETITKG
ncbi:MAG TPA: DUF1553 domain-containing protein, partial [Gemmataceae bacterium]